MRLTTAALARFVPPGSNRFLREPDRKASALAQSCVILRPIRHQVPLLGDVVTASGIGLEWHSRIRDQESRILLCHPASVAKSFIICATKPMKTAFATLKGFEVMRMIRRGHCVLTQPGTTGEIRLMNQLFGLTA